MKQNSSVHRVPTILLAILLGIGALFAVIATARTAVAAPGAVFDCTAAGMNVNDCESLVALYESTNGTGWTVSTNWLSGSPCANSWYGVTCVNGDRVAEINLPENNLVGPLPANIGNMNQLTSMNLFSNTITGTIPASLPSLNKLTFLQLGDNAIEGTIPTSIDQLTNLQYLALSRNSFEGEIPVDVANLADLQFLYLNGNKLRGAVPAEICNLTLTTLNLGFNALDTNTANSDICLDTVDPSWRATQTVPPVDPQFVSITLNATNSSLILSWTPIPYANSPGFYEVLVGTQSGVYDALAGARTQDKLATGVVVEQLQPSTTYFVVVRTQSNATDDNPNIVVSDYSQEISAETVAVRLADFQAGPAGLAGAAPLLAALLVAALLLGTTAVVFWWRGQQTGM
jgi:hypothetical protein